jgi:hypothetical protein
LTGIAESARAKPRAAATALARDRRAAKSNTPEAKATFANQDGSWRERADLNAT